MVKMMILLYKLRHLTFLKNVKTTSKGVYSVSLFEVSMALISACSVEIETMSRGQTDPQIFPFLMEKAATAGFKLVYAKEVSTGLMYNLIWGWGLVVSNSSLTWELDGSACLDRV